MTLPSLKSPIPVTFQPLSPHTVVGPRNGGGGRFEGNQELQRFQPLYTDMVVPCNMSPCINRVWFKRYFYSYCACREILFRHTWSLKTIFLIKILSEYPSIFPMVLLSIRLTNCVSTSQDYWIHRCYHVAIWLLIPFHWFYKSCDGLLKRIWTFDFRDLSLRAKPQIS